MNPVALKNEGEKFKHISVSMKPMFVDVGFSYEHLQVNKIILDNPLPCYGKASASPYPLIVRELSSDLLYCIDGDQQVEKALQDGKETALCHISSVHEIDGIELGIRRMSVRMVPQAGKASYSEILRNVHIVVRMLMASDNLFRYHHGGDRRSKGYVQNRADDIVLLLEERLGKSKTTILAYLNHSRYITPAVLQCLAEVQAPKAFFEAVEKYKSEAVKLMKADGKTEEDVTLHVSHVQSEFYEVYEKNKDLRALLDFVKARIDLELKKRRHNESLPTTAEIITLENDRKSSQEEPEAREGFLHQEIRSCGETLISLSKEVHDDHELLRSAETILVKLNAALSTFKSKFMWEAVNG